MVVLVLVATGLSNQYEQANGGGGRDSGAYENGGKASDASPEGMLLLAGKPPSPNPNPTRDEWREEQDLNAQQNMAKWALGTMFAALASVFVTAIGILYIKLTLDATRGMLKEAAETTKAAGKAVEVAERQLVASERPWIKVDVGIAGDITLAENEVSIPFIVTLENVGSAPATSVHADPKLYPMTMSGGFDAMKEIWANGAVSAPAMPPNLGNMIFPGETVSYQHGVGMGRDEIRKEIERLGFDMKHIIPELVMKVTYRSPIDNAFHTTVIVGTVSRIDANGRPHLAIPIDVPKVNRSEIAFVRGFFSGYAN